MAAGVFLFCAGFWLGNQKKPIQICLFRKKGQTLQVEKPLPHNEEINKRTLSTRIEERIQPQLRKGR